MISLLSAAMRSSYNIKYLTNMRGGQETSYGHELTDQGSCQVFIVTSNFADLLNQR